MTGVPPGRDVGELFARADIMDLMHRYCRSADLGDVEQMVGCFAEDATIDLFGGAPGGMLHGSAALRELLAPLLGKVLAGSHYLANPEFRFTGADEAILHCYLYSMQRFAPGTDVPERHRWGRYEVRARRQAGGWRIQDLRLFAASESGGDRAAEHAGRPFPAVF